MLTLRNLFSNTNLPLIPLNDDFNQNQLIRSVTVIESTNVATWLQGGEFLLITEETLLHKVSDSVKLLQTLISFRCAALVIKGDPAHLSPEFVQEVETSHFPVFLLPQDVTYLAIMNPINEQLFMLKQAIYLKQNLGAYLLRTPNPVLDTLYSPTLDLSSPLWVSVLVAEKQLAETADDFNEQKRTRLLLTEKLENLVQLKQLDDYILLEEMSGLNLLLIHRQKDSQALLKIWPLFDETIPFHWGVSDCLPLTQTYEAFQQANFAQRMEHLIPQQKVLCHFTEVEFYQLLDKVSLDESLQHFFRFTKILQKHPQLLNTLEVYFRSNEQLKTTSDQLFIHINTLRYRLERIHELTGLDYTKSSDKVKLFLGIIHLKNQSKVSE